MSLQVTAGNVYDNLSQTMSKENNDAKAAAYFDEAERHYTQAAERDPSNGNAISRGSRSSAAAISGKPDARKARHSTALNLRPWA